MGRQANAPRAWALIASAISLGVSGGAILGMVLAKAPATISVAATYVAGSVLAVLAATVGLTVWDWLGAPPASPKAAHVDGRGPMQAVIAGSFGAAAFALAYSGLGPHAWFHAHQYAIGAAVIALGAAATLAAALLSTGTLGAQVRGLLGYMNAGFGLMALAGVATLVASGKLAMLRKDWPANVIFITLGVWIAVVSLRLALQTRGHRARSAR